jgi:hypothetical protein
LRIARPEVSRFGASGNRAALEQAFGVSGGDPTAFFGDADGNNLVFLLVDGVEHGGGREQ